MSIEKKPANVESRVTASDLKESQLSADEHLRLNNIVSGIPGIAWESWGAPDSDGERVEFFNNHVEALLGYTAAEWLAIPNVWFSLIHPDDREMVKRFSLEKFALREDYKVEFRWIAKDGRSVWVESHAAIKYDEQGQPAGLRGLTVDITRRKLIEEELNLQKNRLQHVFDHAPSFSVILRGPEMVFEMANPTYYRLVGDRQLIGRTVREVFPEFETQGINEILTEVYQTGVPYTTNELEVLMFTPDRTRQETLYVNVMYSPLTEADGTISGIMSYGIDVTEQVLSRIKIEESEQRYLTLFKVSPLPMWVFDLDTLRFLSVNEAAVRHYGYSEEEYLKMSIMDIRPPEEAARVVEHLRTDYSGIGKSHIFRHRKKDGTLIDMEVSSNRINFNGRNAELVLAYDITERRRAEIALKKAEEDYRQMVESSPGIVYLHEPAPPYLPVYVSPNIKDIGYSPEECYANPDLWKEIIHPEDRERVINEFKAAVEQGSDAEIQYRIIARDGSILWWKDKARFVFDEEGRRAGWQGIILDITATKKLEQQLLQAQKLESVGLLAGGVAHDFNNMLTAINGYSDLILLQLKEGDPLRRSIEEIRKAGQRSASLTGQLLAFSRQQVLQPKVSNINELITDTLSLLERLIGEDVQIMTSLDHRAGKVEVDPGQFSQIIMNLAVNARDVMPQGGKLTIETANIFLDSIYTYQFPDVPPGAYVLVTITDTGTGMSQEIRRHIFEPFFTTKKLGLGTGLGLATVYGIVKQSGGTIDVFSEEGLGTSFKIYLPQIAAEVSEPAVEETVSEIAEGTETILVVEDEELVRNLAKIMLEECGYTVIEAANGLKALEICQDRNFHFDLLMTDVVMPQMGGRELAEKLKQSLPNLRVLFTSGYTDDLTVRHDIIETRSSFIQKPYTFDALAQKVRELLDSGEIKIKN